MTTIDLSFPPVWPVSVQCGVLGVSATDYHQRRARRTRMHSGVTRRTKLCWCTFVRCMPRHAVLTAGRACGGNWANAGCGWVSSACNGCCRSMAFVRAAVVTSVWQLPTAGMIYPSHPTDWSATFRPCVRTRPGQVTSRILRPKKVGCFWRW